MPRFFQRQFSLRRASKAVVLAARCPLKHLRIACQTLRQGHREALESSLGTGKRSLALTLLSLAEAPFQWERQLQCVRGGEGVLAPLGRGGGSCQLLPKLLSPREQRVLLAEGH